VYPIKKTNPLAIGLQGLAGFAQGFVKQKNVEEEKAERERIRKENEEFQRKMAEEARAWQQENINYDRAWKMYDQVLKLSQDIGPDAPEELKQAVEVGRVQMLDAIKKGDWDGATAIFANFNSALPEIEQYSESKKEAERRKNIADQLRIEAVRSNDPFMVSVADTYEKTGEIPEGVFSSRGSYLLAIKDPRASAQVLREAYDENGELKPGYEWVENVKPILETNAKTWEEKTKEDEANKLSAQLTSAAQVAAQVGVFDPELQSLAAEAEATRDPVKIREALYKIYDSISRDVNADQGMQVYSNVAKIYADAGVPIPDDLKSLADTNPAEAYRQAVNAAITSSNSDAVISAVNDALPILQEYAAEIPGASEAISKFITAATPEEKAQAARELSPMISKAIDAGAKYASEERLLKRYSNANTALSSAIQAGNTKAIAGLQASGLIDGKTAENAMGIVQAGQALSDVQGGEEIYKIVATFSPIVPGDDGNARLMTPSELEDAITKKQEEYARLLSEAGITGPAADAALSSLRHAMTAAWYEAKKDMGREWRANEQLELQRKQYALSEKRAALEAAGGKTGRGMSDSEIRLRAKEAMKAAFSAAMAHNCARKDALGGESWIDTKSPICAPLYKDWAENYNLIQMLSPAGSQPPPSSNEDNGGDKEATPPSTSAVQVPKDKEKEAKKYRDMILSGENRFLSMALRDLESGELNGKKAGEAIKRLAAVVGTDPVTLGYAFQLALADTGEKKSEQPVSLGTYIKPGKITPEQLTQIAPALKVVSEKAGMPADAALAIMWLETDRTLDPKVNSKGLFQVVKHGDMSKLSPEKQAELYSTVYLEGNPYLRQAIADYKKGKIPFGRLYLAHFLPKYWDAPEDTRIPDRYIKVNPLFKDDPTVGGIIRKAGSYYNEIMEAKR